MGQYAEHPGLGLVDGVLDITVERHGIQQAVLHHQGVQFTFLLAQPCHEQGTLRTIQRLLITVGDTHLALIDGTLGRRFVLVGFSEASQARE